ncbi:MAG: hypothetical protein R3204_07310, partial [Oceanospirillum sp.]|nr:hypothetical protein [Oceanospirillum sp.]
SNIPYLAQATLDKKQEGSDGWLSSSSSSTQLNISIWDTSSGEKVFNWSENYQQASPVSIVSKLEYQLPLQLKTSLKEVGHVIQAEKGLVYFDLGAAANVKPGEIFRVFRAGKELINADGEPFGALEDQTGIIKVLDVQSTYATAEVLLGRLSIEADDYVERTEDQDPTLYRGKIISSLDDKVAISLGKKVGVTEGSYYAVFKDVKSIQDGESFREEVGQIRIEEVEENFSKGRLSLSNHYDLAKAMMNEGDYVEEIEPTRKDQFSVGILNTSILGDDSSSIYTFGYQQDSSTQVDLVYRAKVGFGDAFLLSGGVMNSVNHSQNIFYGLDVMYLDGLGANLFLSVDIPTPFAKAMDLNMETGYIMGTSDKYEGVNFNVSIKYPMDMLSDL